MGKFAALHEAHISLNRDHKDAVALVGTHADEKKLDHSFGSEKHHITSVRKDKLEGLHKDLKSAGFKSESSDEYADHHIKKNTLVSIAKHPRADGGHDITVSSSYHNHMNESVVILGPMLEAIDALGNKTDDKLHHKVTLQHKKTGDLVHHTTKGMESAHHAVADAQKKYPESDYDLYEIWERRLKKHRDIKKLKESADQIEEGLRKIGQYEVGNKKATVHRDAEWGEYRVKHHVDGKHQGEDSDYHTDDKEEAHHYAKRWAEGHYDKKNESTEDDKGLAAAHKKAKETSEKEGCVQHVRKSESGHHYVSDWYAHDDTVATYNHGRLRESTELTEAEKLTEDRAEGKTEFDANHDLDPANNHHVYVKSRGKNKSIAGPFRSKEEAEKHPARKFGDGVATADQIHH